MITFAVCDDNQSFALELSQQIFELCAKHAPDPLVCRVLNPFTSPAALKEYIDTKPVGVVFLDIDMPGTNGFELAKYIRSKSPDTLIIFVSSFDDFVYESFEYSPFRFLRKSKLRDELPHVFAKVIEYFTSEKESVIFDTTEGKQVIRVNDILYIENSGNYFIVSLINGDKLKCRGSVSTAEALIAGRDFFRIQQSYLVNCNRIQTVRGNDAVLSDGTALSISRRKTNEFRSFYLKFLRRRF